MCSNKLSYLARASQHFYPPTLPSFLLVIVHELSILALNQCLCFCTKSFLISVTSRLDSSKSVLSLYSGLFCCGFWGWFFFFCSLQQIVFTLQKFSLDPIPLISDYEPISLLPLSSKLLELTRLPVFNSSSLTFSQTQFSLAPPKLLYHVYQEPPLSQIHG